jgi:hypothetical protein
MARHEVRAPFPTPSWSRSLRGCRHVKRTRTGKGAAPRDGALRSAEVIGAKTARRLLRSGCATSCARRRRRAAAAYAPRLFDPEVRVPHQIASAASTRPRSFHDLHEVLDVHDRRRRAGGACRRSSRRARGGRAGRGPASAGAARCSAHGHPWSPGHRDPGDIGELASQQGEAAWTAPGGERRAGRSRPGGDDAPDRRSPRLPCAGSPRPSAKRDGLARGDRVARAGAGYANHAE